ncbi:transcriptional repressor [Pajaroellobacter abortibovis]|uniref:Ferric uptake regulation protein n=2 Tax=Pajaroellobacter abortibovis TaxID=1882918 RepID=A0A1L6MZI8_9BACT|nr:transcriptional repressor [Pajaroellobacter abortibovis]
MGSRKTKEVQFRNVLEVNRLRNLLQDYMIKQGLRSTDQRRLIVDTFFAAESHISIEELLAKVRKVDARVGYATVYRTLRLLTKSGVALERHFGDGLTRYELADSATDHHDHLICIECGAIQEFKEPSIERLQEAIAIQYGYVLCNHKHEMYGICPLCQKQSLPPHEKSIHPA